MLDLDSLSTKYKVRKMTEEDAEIIFQLEKGNPLYFEYFPPQASIESVKEDLKALPPGKTYEDKYYIGFFEGDVCIAILDLILAFPDEETILIGLFMVDIRVSRKGIGTSIIEEVLEEVHRLGYQKARLGYMKGNPQSQKFWKKCKFVETGEEKKSEKGRVVILERVFFQL